MSDNYVQKASNNGTTSWTVTLNGVVAGNAIVVFLGDGSSSSPASATVSDGDGSYTPKGTAVTDAGNNVWLQRFLLENASAGTHTITCALPSGQSGIGVAVEVGVTSQPGYLDTQTGSINNPGTGADAIATSTLTIGSASTLLAFCADTSTFGSNAPVAGTGFTDRGSGASSDIGDWRVESKAAASNSTATFTAGTGTGGNDFRCLAIAIANVGGGGGGAAFNAVPHMTQYRRRMFD